MFLQCVEFVASEDPDDSKLPRDLWVITDGCDRIEFWDEAKARKVFYDVVRHLRRGCSLYGALRAAEKYSTAKNDPLEKGYDRYAVEEIAVALYGKKIQRGIVKLPDMIKKLRSGDIEW